MSITYQVEPLDQQLIWEITPLIQEHWEEIASHKDIQLLEPDWDRYMTLYDLDMLRIFTVRDWPSPDDCAPIAHHERGALVGYFVTIVTHHLHYPSLTYGINDVLYLHDAYRGSTIGYRMMKLAMDDLKKGCGVDILVVHMKVKHEFRALLQRLGFQLTEENWEARL